MVQKKMRNTAEFLIECLEEEGVHYIFGIPGEENLAIINALEHSKIEFITVRHEQGAAFMADVYGRLTGKAGVCMATLGPGATNLITGVADADCDGAPVVAISGQVGTDKIAYHGSPVPRSSGHVRAHHSPVLYRRPPRYNGRNHPLGL